MTSQQSPQVNGLQRAKHFWRNFSRRLPRPRPPEFATFWNGPLDSLTYSCLASFPYYGARLRLYTYAADIDVPDGVEIADARSICRDETLVGRYIADGRVSDAKFSNLFRYEMIQQTGSCWVDTDIICLRKPDFSNEAFVFGRQLDPSDASSINNAVLKLPKDHRIVADLVDRAKASVDLDQLWGVIGPTLLTEMTKVHGLDAQARDIPHFYPIVFDHFWKPLLPDYRRAVDKATHDATFLHLWHEFFRRSSYDKSACAPVGSFFHDMCRRVGTFDRFSRVYEAGELRTVLSGWIRDDADRETDTGVTDLK